MAAEAVVEAAGIDPSTYPPPAFPPTACPARARAAGAVSRLGGVGGRSGSQGAAGKRGGLPQLAALAAWEQPTVPCTLPPMLRRITDLASPTRPRPSAHPQEQRTGCPFQQAGLKEWGDAATWGGKLPSVSWWRCCAAAMLWGEYTRQVVSAGAALALPSPLLRTAALSAPPMPNPLLGACRGAAAHHCHQPATNTRVDCAPMPHPLHDHFPFPSPSPCPSTSCSPPPSSPCPQHQRGLLSACSMSAALTGTTSSPASCPGTSCSPPPSSPCPPTPRSCCAPAPCSAAPPTNRSWCPPAQRWVQEGLGEGGCTRHAECVFVPCCGCV